MQIGEEKMSAKFGGFEDQFIHFHTNGTFSDTFKYPGYASKIKWSYNHAEKTISTDGDVKKIEVITEKRLVLSGNKDGKKFRLVYKRSD